MVQVIPKELEEQDVFGKKIIPWLSLILVVVVLFSYFYFSRQLSNTKQELSAVEKELARIQDEDFRALEGEVLTHRRRIDDVLRLLRERSKASGPLAFLEAYVHPAVYFSEFSLDTAAGRLQLEGIARNFVALGEQIYVFKKEDFIKDIKLSNIGLAEAGEIKFGLDISFVAQSDNTNQ